MHGGRPERAASHVVTSGNGRGPLRLSIRHDRPRVGPGSRPAGPPLPVFRVGGWARYIGDKAFGPGTSSTVRWSQFGALRTGPSQIGWVDPRWTICQASWKSRSSPVRAARAGEALVLGLDRAVCRADRDAHGGPVQAEVVHSVAVAEQSFPSDGEGGVLGVRPGRDVAVLRPPSGRDGLAAALCPPFLHGLKACRSPTLDRRGDARAGDIGPRHYAAAHACRTPS